MELSLNSLDWTALEGRTLLDLAAASTVPLSEATILSLRSSHLDTPSFLEQLQELVAAMPKLIVIDLSDNFFTGPRFRSWIYKWLANDPKREMYFAGNPQDVWTQENAVTCGIKLTMRGSHTTAF